MLYMKNLAVMLNFNFSQVTEKNVGVTKLQQRPLISPNQHALQRNLIHVEVSPLIWCNSRKKSSSFIVVKNVRRVTMRRKNIKNT